MWFVHIADFLNKRKNAALRLKMRIAQKRIGFLATFECPSDAPWALVFKNMCLFVNGVTKFFRTDKLVPKFQFLKKTFLSVEFERNIVWRSTIAHSSAFLKLFQMSYRSPILVHPLPTFPLKVILERSRRDPNFKRPLWPRKCSKSKTDFGFVFLMSEIL